jgi:putative SOS response-associated peptidase YedK
MMESACSSGGLKIREWHLLARLRLNSMCGRIALYTPPERLARRLGAALAGDLGDAAEPRWNIPPTQTVLALVHPRREKAGASTKETGHPERLLASFRWGLIPWWAKDPSIGNKQFNARAETLEKRSAFRSALAERRCLVVADGFYEWKARSEAGSGPKTPLFFTRSDGEPLTFAGLWETWRDQTQPRETRQRIHSCTIVTTAAGPDVEAVHNRMPVVVEPGDIDTWLASGPLDPGTLERVLEPSPAGTLSGLVVSTRVNSVKNEGPELVEAAR